MRMPIMVGRFNNGDQHNDEQLTSAAVSRGDHVPGYDMKGGNAYVGGQSRKEEQERAYDRDAGHTKPKASRREQARTEALIEEARGIDAKQRASQVSQEQPQQQEQPRERRNRFDTDENRQREADLSAHFRGRMDAMQASGKEQFGERMGFDNQRQFDIASKSFHQTKQDLATEFKAAGTKPRQGQTVVEALRERQASGNFKPIVDPNGNQYTLRDDKLIKSDRHGNELSAMPAEEVHQFEANANKAKNLQSNQGHEIGSS